MKKNFNDFPEIIIADATYELNAYRMPVFLQVIVDGAGETEIVSVFLVTNEDADTLLSMLELFKKHNPRYINTRTVLTDKYLNARLVYKDAMPNVDLQLCMFHVLNSIKREIHCVKLGITSAEKRLCLEIIQKIASSQSMEEYKQHHTLLLNTGINSVIDYYQRSWHTICEEWVVGLKRSCHYGNNTTNRLESINQKLKQIISRFESLECFFKDLKMVILSLRQERNCRRANIFLKQHIANSSNDSEEDAFVTTLTPMAYKLVAKQLQLSREIQLPTPTGSKSDSVQMHCLNEAINVSSQSCTCHFFTLNDLPCKHILAYRRTKRLSLFDQCTINRRWTLEYNDMHSKLLFQLHKHIKREPSTALDEVASPMIYEQHTRKPISQQEKYKELYVLCQQIAAIASESGIEAYNHKKTVLQDLLQNWQNGRDVKIVALDHKKTTKVSAYTTRSLLFVLSLLLFTVLIKYLVAFHPELSIYKIERGLIYRFC